MGADKKAKKRVKRAKRAGLDRGRQLQDELDRIDAVLAGDKDRLKELEEAAKDDPLGAGVASSFDRKRLGKKEKAKLQNVRTRLFNTINKGKTKNRALVDEFARQGLSRSLGTGTTLLGSGSAAKAPSIATTGTTLLRSS
jgi:hypothetical protein